jgi:hypothetical protein
MYEKCTINTRPYVVFTYDKLVHLFFRVPPIPLSILWPFELYKWNWLQILSICKKVIAMNMCRLLVYNWFCSVSQRGGNVWKLRLDLMKSANTLNRCQYILHIYPSAQSRFRKKNPSASSIDTSACYRYVIHICTLNNKPWIEVTVVGYID